MAGRLLHICRFGAQPVDYGLALALQQALFEKRKQGLIPDTILELQHPHVYTVGKRGEEADVRAGAAQLASLGARVFRVPRGGQTTYHGPGQLVAYPIVDLRALGAGPRRFVEGLEAAMVRAAGAHGVAASATLSGDTGVWVGARKLGAVGVRISQGVTSHGIALNVATDLSYFDHILACGLDGVAATSLSAEVGRGSAGAGVGADVGVDVGTVGAQFLDAFCHAFGYRDVVQLAREDVLREHVAGADIPQPLPL